jgi:hypothetical protein
LLLLLLLLQDGLLLCVQLLLQQALGLVSWDRPCSVAAADML